MSAEATPGSHPVWGRRPIAVILAVLVAASCAPAHRQMASSAGTAGTQPSVGTAGTAGSPGTSDTTANATSSTARAVNPYTSQEHDLLSAFRRTFLTPEGGVRSYYLDGTQEDPQKAGVGHERLSESTALLLTYADRAGDPDLFDLAHSYYVRRQRSDTGLAYWKLDKNEVPVKSDDTYSSAPIEEIRIAQALSDGAARFARSSYRSDASLVARALLPAVRDGVLTDNVTWGRSPPEASANVEIGYLDTRGMRALSNFAAPWRTVADKSLKVLQGALVDDGPPRQRYSLETKQYFCPARCGTTPALWSALNLVAAGQTQKAQQVASYYLQKMAQDGRISSEYTVDGGGSGSEELASYALLVRLTYRLGDHQAAEGILENRILPHRVPFGSLTGLFSYDQGDAPAFDNLEILLALQELAVTAGTSP